MKFYFQPIGAMPLLLLIFACISPSTNADDSKRLTLEQENATDIFYFYRIWKRPGLERFLRVESGRGKYSNYGARGWKPRPIGRKK